MLAWVGLPVGVFCRNSSCGLLTQSSEWINNPDTSLGEIDLVSRDDRQTVDHRVAAMKLSLIGIAFPVLQDALPLGRTRVRAPSASFRAGG